jgi:glutathione synthase
MNIKIGIVMDPIESITPYKDTSLAMLLEAQSRGWEIHYMQQHDLYVWDGAPHGRTTLLNVEDDHSSWFQLGKEQELPLQELQVILMRKDPPFDMEYIYSTYILELAEKQGTLVVNRPSSLRDANEKLFTSHFPQCCPETLVSRDQDRLQSFARELGDIIVKPLDGMGGASIFRIRKNDPNTRVILETITEQGSRTIMAQRFLPEFKQGDKRILIVDGEAVPYALARIPAEGETRANLAAGGTGVGVELTERDQWIADQVGPILREMGLLFVGLDVIGDFLTEINVTSPTCVRELDQQFKLNISGQLMDAIETKLAMKNSAS